MNSVNWLDMAPWIAIAVTLILSIIIPLLTQIVNNSFQLKQKELEQKKQLVESRVKVYCDFSKNVGACIAHADAEALRLAGSSIQNMYFFMPEEKWNELDELYSLIRRHEWAAAEPLLIKLTKIASKLLNEETNSERKRIPHCTILKRKHQES